jgi:arylsulfatase A-like enzyme
VTGSRPRETLWTVLLVVGGLLIVVALALALRGPAPAQRVILIVVDTLRRDFVSAYGESRTPTPHIDSLAARGQVFRNFNASFHQTSMSMTSLFTGRTPSVEFESPEKPLFWNSYTWCGLHRFTESTDPENCIPAVIPTLAERLRAAGYETLGVTSNQFLYEPSGFSRGFDAWVEVGERPPAMGPWARLTLKEPAGTRDGPQVNRAVADLLNRRTSDRFFLYVHYMDVHDYGAARVSYARSVAAVDAAIGRLLEGLHAAGLLEDATVVLVADHGERLRERHALAGEPGHLGNPSFQEHLQVPLIVAPATRRDESAFLRTEDLFHLILELAAVETSNESDLERGELYLSELGFRTYLRDGFKTTIRRSDGALTLFDLDEDPGELRNAAALHPEVASDHRRRMDALAARLSASAAVAERLSDDDRERLRALGYLDDEP